MTKEDCMRIIQLFNGNDTGGALTQLLNLLEGLKRKNVEVKVLLIGRNERIINELRNMDIEYVITNFNSFRMTRKTIRGVDIIHSHGFKANLHLILSSIFLNIRRVTTMHSDYQLDYKNSKLKSLIIPKLIKTITSFFDKTVILNNSFKEELLERGFKSEKLSLIENGIKITDNKILLSYEQKSIFYDQYGLSISEEDILVGMAARIHPVKGYEFFINSSVKALENNKRLRFIICGFGDSAEEDNLIRLIDNSINKDRISFIGRVNDMNTFYNSLDVFVSTSINESFSYVTVEAALCKKKVCLSRVELTKNLIIDGENGFSFEPFDVEGYIFALDNTIKTNNDIGQKLFDSVSKKYSNNNMTNKYIELYKEIIL
jgi:glycosyltransferase involved in cell wall biosynthesis